MRFTALVCLTSLLACAASACPRPAKPCGPVVVYEQCRPQPRWCHWFQRPEQIDRVSEKQSAEPAKAATVAKDSPEVKWTTIRGRIIWDKALGEAPKREPIDASRDKEIANMDGELLTENWVIHPRTLGIKNAIVWLAPEPPGSASAKDRKQPAPRSFRQDEWHPTLTTPEALAVHIDNFHCRYIPHVVAARAGQDLVIQNHAPVPHHFRLDATANDSLNVLLPAGADKTIKNLRAERGPLRFDSAIHPWMYGYLRVFDHPYFAVTDDDGGFEIKHAPVMNGKLRLFIWHENGFHRGAAGRFGQAIEVKPGAVDFGTIKFEPPVAKK